MDIKDRIPVIRVAIRGANGRMGLQAIYASMENNQNILERFKTGHLRADDVWIDIVYGAFTADIPTVQQLMAGVLRSEKNKILEGYDKTGSPIYRMKPDGKKHELRTNYLKQTIAEEPQRDHVIPFDRQEIVNTPEGMPAINILSADRQTILSTIHHANVRLGELSAEAIKDRVLDTANDMGVNVLLSCVGDTAKSADRMKSWLDEIHDKGYAMGFLESAPAKGWENRMLSRQDEVSILTTRNYSPTGTLFRTSFSLKKPLFEYNRYEKHQAMDKFKGIMESIIDRIITQERFMPFARLMDKKPFTIKEIEGEPTIINFPLGFLTVSSPDYLSFSFYEDNEYGFIMASLLPTLKALGQVCKKGDKIGQAQKQAMTYEAVTNIPGIFGTRWMTGAPEEILSRGSAMSTSSCTTNGNIVGDFIMILALYAYVDFFYPRIEGYYLCPPGAASEKHYKEVINEAFAAFDEYLKGLMARRSHMIRTVLGFYYDEISFMNTEMQHGLTRSESPDVIAFLRETTSGSQTEVPRLLSLPEKERSYFTGMKEALSMQYKAEKDQEVKKEIKARMDEIDHTLSTIDSRIDIVQVLEGIEAAGS